MAVSASQGFIALQRFGLGARPGDLGAIRSDPRGAVLAEIDPAAVRLIDPELPDTMTALTAIRQIQMERKANKQATAQQPAPDASSMEPMADNGDADPAMMDAKPGKKGKGKKNQQLIADANGDPMK